MPKTIRSHSRTASIVALLFWVALVLAGGASRADAFGQVLVRIGAGVSIVALLFSVRFVDLRRDRMTAAILTTAATLFLVQLIPLPSALWINLPGRSNVAALTPVLGPVARPLSLTPSATLNAIFSLLPPAAMWLAMTGLSQTERQRFLTPVLLAVIFSAFLGLIQFSGVEIDSPLVNDTPGASSGIFANRNHQALFLAIGILLTASWVSTSRWLAKQTSPLFRLAIGAGLMAWLMLMILATGSRAGAILGLLALVLAPLSVFPELRRLTRSTSRRMLALAAVGAMALIAISIYLAVDADRAVSFSRVSEMDVSADMRFRAFPLIIDMVARYFPFGTGAGSFDPVFRMNEPLQLLKFTYFNHAHNDFLEFALEGGLVGVGLVVIAIGWWLYRSRDVWRRRSTDAPAARTGTMIILMILAASAVDYPVRTPLMMALLVIAAAWMVDGASGGRPLRPASDNL